MNKLSSIALAVAALADVQRHEQNAESIQTGRPSDESGQDDEDRLAEDDRAARHRAAQRAEGAQAIGEGAAGYQRRVFAGSGDKAPVFTHGLR